MFTQAKKLRCNRRRRRHDGASDVRNLGNSRVKRRDPTYLQPKEGSMAHYKANLRDIEFNLFEALGIGPILDSGSVGELDTATTREILAEVARFAQGPVAQS